MYFNSLPGASSFPVVETADSSATTTASTNHIVDLPPGFQSGDLLIAMVGGFIDTGSTPVDVSWPAGWTEFFEEDATSGTLHLAVSGAYRQADGTEGSTVTATTNLNVLAAHNTYRISGAADPATQPPQVATTPFLDSGGTTVDPPSLTPTGGAKNYLWLAVAGWRRTGRTLTGSPTNYTDTIDINSSGGSSGLHLASARRQLNAASEDPGVFTLSSNSERRVGATIAVHPASSSVDITVTVSHTTSSGGSPTSIVSSSTTIDANTADPYAYVVGNDSDGETYTSANPQRLRVQIHVDAVNDGGSFVLAYDSGTNPSNLTTPTVTVPEIGIFLLVLVPLIPVVMGTIWRRRRIAGRLISVLLAISIGLGFLAQDVPAVMAAPDNFYFRDTTTNGASPSGEDMNGTQGSSENTLTFNTVNQDAYWYTDVTYPTGDDDASIAAGDYTLNMYFDQLPSAGAEVKTNTCTIGGGSSSTNCPISPALTDTTKTFLIFQATTSNNEPTNSSVRCYVANTSTITCDRDGTAGTANIAWQTAEFSSGVTVEHLTPVCNVDGDADPDITNVTITAVSDMAKTFLLYSHKTSGSTNDANDPRTVRLTSTTNVEIRQHGYASCAAGSESALQVVQYTNASVTRGETGAMTGTSLPVTGLSSVNTSKTMLLYSYRFNGGGAAMCDRMLRGRMDSATSLLFSRGDGAGGCASQNIPAIAWERIEFTDATTVQQVEPAMTGNITVERQISLGSDDAEEPAAGGTVDLTSSDLELIREGSSNNQQVGMRWQNVTVPQGAYITNAYIEFEADESDDQASEPTTITFWGEDADDTVTFDNLTNKVTTRTKTSSSVTWSNVPDWVIDNRYVTPDLSPVIQEIVDRGGWASGNNMVIIVTGSGQRVADSFNKSGAYPALLHIEYAGGTSTANVTISSVDTSRTVVFAGGQHTAGQAIGEGTYKGDDVLGAMVGRHTLTTSTNLQVVRDDTGGNARWTSYVVQFPTSGSVDITITVSHTTSSGGTPTTIVSSSTTIGSSTANPYGYTVGNDVDGETYTSSNPQRLRVQIHVDTINNGGSFVLAYDSAANPTNLQTPTVVVPEAVLSLALGALLIPGLSGILWRRGRGRSHASEATQGDPPLDRTVPQRKE